MPDEALVSDAIERTGHGAILNFLIVVIQIGAARITGGMDVTDDVA